MLSRSQRGFALSAHNFGSLLRKAAAVPLVLLIVCLAMPAVVASALPPINNDVTFYQNDSLPGAPIDQQAAASTPLTSVADLGSTFANPGYVFLDWSTTANNSSGSATYADGQSFDFETTIVLFAQWAPIPTSTITFVGNGATGSVSSITGNVGNSLTLPAGIGFTDSGYTFAGWNSAAGGEGIPYAAGGTFTLASSISLYAQWIETNYVVNFHSEGGSVIPISTSFNITSNTVELPTPTYSGYTFTGWFTAASGGTPVGMGGSSTVLTTSTDLYAQWTPVIVPPVQPVDSTISFSSNGGVGSIAVETGADGTSVSLPGGIGMSYVGKTFASWNTVTNGSGTSYNVDAPLKLNGSITLYAQWDTLLVFKAPSVLLGAVGTFSSSSAKLSPALKAQVKKLASLVKTGGYVRVTLYGYTNDTGTAAHKLSISRSRANAVAVFLRSELSVIHAKRVAIDAAGEGSVKGKTNAVYRRVEVFVTA